jgi:microcystin-dependent protein
MAQKKITELQLRDNVTSDVNFPVDDGIQSYRVTALQILQYFESTTDKAFLGLTTKGDILIRSDTGNADRIGVGTNGYALTAKSSETKGLAYVPPVPIGCILPFGGTSAPDYFLLCNGQLVSRSTYANLFSAIGTAYGSGDGSTTFAVPDMRGKFLRGAMTLGNISGSGTAASNNATFTGHNIIRTGMRVRLSSGTLSGLSTSTNYYAIVVDANTLAFATSLANAYSATKIAISGANSAVIIQWEDTDSTSRVAHASGGNTGANVGSAQEDTIKAHNHTGNYLGTNGNSTGNGPYDGVAAVTSAIALGPSSAQVATEGGTETRPPNVSVNYIIRF